MHTRKLFQKIVLLRSKYQEKPDLKICLVLIQNQLFDLLITLFNIIDHLVVKKNTHMTYSLPMHVRENFEKQKVGSISFFFQKYKNFAKFPSFLVFAGRRNGKM